MDSKEKEVQDELYDAEKNHTVEAAEVNQQTETEDDTTEQKSKVNKKQKKDNKLDELGQKLADINDRHLRLQAEFDNFRKRTLKEKSELIQFGGESVLTSILPIIDDFDRALGTMNEVPDEDPAKIGFLLIFSKFRDFLKNNLVTEIEATGQIFDVDLHDAITKIPAPSDELKGKVVEVIQKGYMLHGKVIRYAKVVIGD